LKLKLLRYRISKLYSNNGFKINNDEGISKLLIFHAYNRILIDLSTKEYKISYIIIKDVFEYIKREPFRGSLKYNEIKHLLIK
jgi:hypothetical protein